MLAGIAQLLRTELRNRRVDCLAVHDLARVLGVPAEKLLAAVAADPRMGTADEPHPMVWLLPPGPLAAGFEPVYRGGRLVLRLASSALPGGPPSRCLVITGRRTGPVRGHDLDEPALGEDVSGELGYTVARMTLLASGWLAVPSEAGTAAEPGQRLFALIRQAWQVSRGPAGSPGRTVVHQVDLGGSVALSTAQGPSSWLVLVLWVGQDGDLELINIYPADPPRPTSETEGQS